jgi:phage terminase large subunit
MGLLNSSGQIINFNAEIPADFEFLFEPKRYKVVYGGRGKGASWGFADALLIIGTQVIPCYPNPTRNLCTRELQKSITDSVHKLLCDRISALGLEEFYSINQKMISGLNGTEFLFGGLKHNVREIKSKEGIDFAWVEEAENVSDESWEVLIPTVRKEGSEIWVSFNTKQPTDATYRRMIMDADDDYIVKKLSYKDNPFFPEVLEKERLRLKAKDAKAYDHVWEGEFDTRFSGAVYAKWIADLKAKGRITERVQHDPEYPVCTLWDLGYGDTNTIWFYQEAPQEILFIDYYENNNEGIGHYCAMLKDKPYKYRAHYVPQDAGRKLMEANGRSIVEQAWKDHGVKMFIIPETTHANRHEGLRKVLPYCWFNAETCAPGLEAVMAYHYEYDEDLQIFKKVPVHDWSSHASCALELLPSVWSGRTVTVKDMERKAKDVKFYRLRRQNNLDKVDPYRVKPMGKHS